MPSTRTPPLSTHVALLRGINVGGKNRVPMATLARLFQDSGCVDVRTYIQSGNVVFRAPAALAARVAPAVEAALAARLGVRAPVIIRTGAQLRRVCNAAPFQGADENHLHVVFLRSSPGASEVRALDPARSPPDEFVVKGQEIYLRLPGGAARSKLTTAYFDRVLGTVSSARHWRTVQALAAMTEQ